MFDPFPFTRKGKDLKRRNILTVENNAKVCQDAATTEIHFAYLTDGADLYVPSARFFLSLFRPCARAT
jgi:hypothetical protein